MADEQNLPAQLADLLAETRAVFAVAPPEIIYLTSLPASERRNLLAGQVSEPLVEMYAGVLDCMRTLRDIFGAELERQEAER